MTVTEARATPVSDAVILTCRIVLAKVALRRADADAALAMSDAATARQHVAELEAEYRELAK